MVQLQRQILSDNFSELESAICSNSFDMKGLQEELLRAGQNNVVDSFCHKEQIGAIRFRLVSMIMGVSSPDKNKNLEEVISLETNFSSLFRGACDTIYAYNEGHVVVLLPDIAWLNHANDVISFLASLEGRENLPNNWLVDFSAVRTFPSLLVGNLMYQQTRLREDGGDLFISWFSEKLLEQMELQLLCKLFNLVCVAGYWFSQGDRAS